MAAHKGHKKSGGRKPGTPNQRTKQWEIFAEYCLNSGLAKYQSAMDELRVKSPKDYITAFHQALQFHKPQLAKTTIEDPNGEPVDFSPKIILAPINLNGHTTKLKAD